MAKKPRPRAKSTPAGKKKRSKRSRAVQELSPEEQAALDTLRARHQDALGVYERGLAAVQRRKFQNAVAAFQELLDSYPEERELQERSRLYLRVCERETARLVPLESPEELVYAATVALNNGALDESLSHLQQAVEQDAGNEQAHYMLAVVYAQTNRPDLATTHLAKAVELEPENRTLARHEADFETLRKDARVRRLLERPPAGRRRARRAMR